MYEFPRPQQVQQQGNYPDCDCRTCRINQRANALMVARDAEGLYHLASALLLENQALHEEVEHLKNLTDGNAS